MEPASASPLRAWHIILLVTLVLSGLAIRIDWVNRTALWCDEAESAINGLTIIETGVPGWKYLGLPVYENTLTELWPEHPEYEFRDSSYSPQGLAVYHGWIPLYSIAGSQWLFGMRPDKPQDPPRVLHGPEDVWYRTVVPRVPSVLFSVLCLVAIFFVARAIAGTTAGFAAVTLMAFNAKTVDFGIQARYYSATLLASTLAIGALLWVLRSGRWRAFLCLGLAEAVLFHTHQFSAVVFAAAAAACTPAIMRKPQWFMKSLAGGALAAALILPWVWFSGFLFTAKNVPKAYKLFDSASDWASYSLSRPDHMITLGLVIATVLLARWKPSLFPRDVGRAIRSNFWTYGLLLFWMVIGYSAFHVIVPAASFFFERLSLVLWTPYVLLISCFTACLLDGLRLKRAPLWAVAFIAVFLVGRGRDFWTAGTLIPMKPQAIAGVVEALASRGFPAGTRFYATPNDHLTYTYYTGLPIQSVAPVRRSFFETYPHPVVFIEKQMELRFPADAAIREVLGPVDTVAAHEAIWNHLAAKDLRAQGFDLSVGAPLPPELQGIADQTAKAEAGFRARYIAEMRDHIIFRTVPFERTREGWLAFFYRFVQPELRIGPNINIRARMANAEVLPVAFSDCLIFISDNPPQ
ncbi:MAG: glycosyltransferase family 39 protein [Terrimicrobiaceae bacterium]|nr:glycosyltransferase family 39 protein [Terrimicrobiaceae bacterium]